MVEVWARMGGSSSRMKRRAARMGPTVWELEGPMPILKSSNRLVFMLVREVDCRGTVVVVRL